MIGKSFMVFSCRHPVTVYAYSAHLKAESAEWRIVFAFRAIRCDIRYMDKIDKTILRVTEEAARLGVQPATICRKATGNARLWERLVLRRRRLNDDLARIEAYLDRITGDERETAPDEREADV